MNKILRCKICGEEAKQVVENFSGYKEGLFYDIYDCNKCLTSFCYPDTSDLSVYDAIYKQSKILAGYERYHYFASLVSQVPQPLQVLKSVEPSYWSVISEIQKDKRPATSLGVLEIGSGLGYLTYALRKSGYQSVGIDVSEEAVSRANNDFGQYYKIADLFNLVNEQTRYDYVVMMDVIEHVDDPKSFLEAAAKLLKFDGKLLVTTPNKSSAPEDNRIWQSDVPPVHLWFMAEETLKYICEDVGYFCEFFDFTDFTKRFYTPKYTATLELLQDNVPRLAKDGTILEKGRVRSIPYILTVPRYIFSYTRRRLRDKIVSKRTTTMCAVISKRT